MTTPADGILAVLHSSGQGFMALRPFGEDQRRLESLGFTASHDVELIRSYEVEPAIWRQSMAEPDLEPHQLTTGQLSGVRAAAEAFFARAGLLPAEVVARLSFTCFRDNRNSAVIYIDCAGRDERLRALLDVDGNVADARAGLRNELGVTVWTEL